MITIKALIEIAGFPQTHVDETMEKVLEMLNKEPTIKIIKKEVGKAEKIKELWSSFVDLELDLDNLAALHKFCFDYLPTSIEIQDITEIKFEVKELNNFINDTLLKIHQYNNAVRNLHAETEILKHKMQKSPK